jgi:hypothetical protein
MCRSLQGLRQLTHFHEGLKVLLSYFTPTSCFSFRLQKHGKAAHCYCVIDSRAPYRSELKWYFEMELGKISTFLKCSVV